MDKKTDTAPTYASLFGKAQLTRRPNAEDVGEDSGGATLILPTSVAPQAADTTPANTAAVMQAQAVAGPSQPEAVENASPNLLETSVVDAGTAQTKTFTIQSGMEPYHGGQPITREVAELQGLIRRECLKRDEENGRLIHANNNNNVPAPEHFATDGRIKAASALVEYYLDLRVLRAEEWHAMTIEWTKNLKLYPLGYRSTASLSQVEGREVLIVEKPPGYDYTVPLKPTLFPPPASIAPGQTAKARAGKKNNVPQEEAPYSPQGGAAGIDAGTSTCTSAARTPWHYDDEIARQRAMGGDSAYKWGW